MKKWIPVILLFLLSTSVSFAQSQANRQGKMKAQRAAFITERIDLTPEESEKFWPMHNQFENDKKAIQKKYKRDKRVINMTDKELEQQMLDSFAKDQEILDLKKSYFKKFKTILPIKKIAMFQVAEREFRETVVRKLREDRREKRKRRMKDN